MSGDGQRVIHEDVPVRPASTVVLLRDGRSGLQTLMLRRNKALIFAGGAWVFPGGALEEGDFGPDADDLEFAARNAAAREAAEESGLAPHPEHMVQLSHWTTPVGEPKRFSTWIFAAPVASDDEVMIDGSEIHDSSWLGVREAVSRHEAGQMNMLPPTYITLCNLARYDSVRQLIDTERETPVPEVFPRFTVDGDQVVVLFRGDSGYATGDAGTPGARHRAGLVEGTWAYTYQDVDAQYAPLMPLD